MLNSLHCIVRPQFDIRHLLPFKTPLKCRTPGLFRSERYELRTWAELGRFFSTNQCSTFVIPSSSMAVGEPPLKVQKHAVHSDGGHGAGSVPEVVSTLRVKKLSATATIPKRGSAGAAGYDLSRYDFLNFYHHALMSPLMFPDI